MELQKHYRTPLWPRKRVVQPIGGPSLAHQSFKDECDINILMSRYLKTGILPDNLTEKQAQYLDCTQYDFQHAMEVVAAASSLFEQLPSAVRNRVDNDPAKLLEFVHDPKNFAEAKKLGLLRPGAEESFHGGNLQTSPSLQTTPPQPGNPVSGPADPVLPTPGKSGGG